MERLRNNFWRLSTADPDLARDEMNFASLDLCFMEIMLLTEWVGWVVSFHSSDKGSIMSSVKPLNIDLLLRIVKLLTITC